MRVICYQSLQLTIWGNRQEVYPISKAVGAWCKVGDTCIAAERIWHDPKYPKQLVHLYARDVIT